jgi:protein-S-isoprenylcysteine O-methyltransferase Ste14
MAEMRTSRIPPPVWTVLIAAAMWVLNRYFPVSTLVPEPSNTLGWGIAAIGPFAPLAALIQFRQARTTMNPHRPEAASRLVTSGVFAWTRNPMYLGLLIFLLGWAVRLGTLTPLSGPLLFVPLIQHVQIFPEERVLRTLFGDDYERYCRRVHRWLGRRKVAT